MGQGTVPVKGLKRDSEYQSANVDIFDGLAPSAGYRPEDEKNDPEKMDQNDAICKYPGKHCLPRLPVDNIVPLNAT
jgi:hypothetical protein